MKVSTEDFERVTEKANEIMSNLFYKNPRLGYSKISEIDTIYILNAIEALENEKCRQCENEGWTWVTDETGDTTRWFCWCEYGQTMIMYRDRILANKKGNN